MTFTLAVLFILTNFDRPASSTLQYDQTLTELAQKRAQYLCDNKQWSHENWMDSFTEKSGHIGENLVKYKKPARMSDYKYGKTVQSKLMASPTHKENIINKKYTHLGIGAACDVTVYLYWGKNDLLQ